MSTSPTANASEPLKPPEPPAILATERLRLRRLTPDDTAFLLQLLNDPAFVANIGDRGVRTPADALAYVVNGPGASYRRNGFGLYRVELAATGAPIGLCGLVRRDTLPDVDIGFAFLPASRAQGYALEAARAVVAEARERVGLSRLVAIVKPGNAPSARLLLKLGMQLEGRVRLPHDPEELELYALRLVTTDVTAPEAPAR
jgi:RimJ/RimL family protein N-acetyltransferase